MQSISASVLPVIFGFMVFLLAAIYIDPRNNTEIDRFDPEVIEYLEQHGCPVPEGQSYE